MSKEGEFAGCSLKWQKNSWNEENEAQMSFYLFCSVALSQQYVAAVLGVFEHIYANVISKTS